MEIDMFTAVEKVASKKLTFPSPVSVVRVRSNFKVTARTDMNKMQTNAVPTSPRQVSDANKLTQPRNLMNMAGPFKSPAKKKST